MMHMTIYWTKQVTLLIDSWKTNSWSSYLLTLLACFLFSAFYQYMVSRRLKLKSNMSSSSASQQPSMVVPLISKLGSGGRVISTSRFATAVFFGVNSAIGYLLMLAVMSFNGGVFLAVVFGLSFGYLLFRSGGGGDDDKSVVVQNTCACS